MQNLGELFHSVGPFVAIMGIGGLIFWFRLEKMKIERGYPIENFWGKHSYPKASDEQLAALKMELEKKSTKMTQLENRVATLERILTDRSQTLSADIDRLRD